jgi:transposase
MKKNETAREFCRRRGVELMGRGVPTAIISRILGVSPSFLCRWKTILSSKQETSQKRGFGSRRNLKREQIAELEQLLSQGATAHGWVNDLWTTKRVAVMIRRHFHVTCSRTHAWNVLTKDLGWTSQRPIQQGRDSDDAEITRWLEEEYPRILKRACRRGAYLVFVDESGFMLAPTMRRSFAPCGHPPICKVPDPHGRISAIGAISISPHRRRFSFHFDLLKDNANYDGDALVPFLEEIHRKIPGPVTLIWDLIPIHHARPVRNYLNRHRKIVEEPFPPYAPGLNPVDKAWSHVKFNRLPNYTPPDLDDLRFRITNEFRRLQKRPALLNAFFQRTKLSL